MIAVLLAAIAVLLFVGRPVGRRLAARAIALRRPAGGLAAVLSLFAAAVLAVREDWAGALALFVLAAVLALAARWRRVRAGPAAAAGMDRRTAEALLGVAPGASREAVEAAYRRLMRRAHPEGGGTAGLAAQLNAARAVLQAARR